MLIYHSRESIEINFIYLSLYKLLDENDQILLQNGEDNLKKNRDGNSPSFAKHIFILILDTIDATNDDIGNKNAV